MFSSTTEKYGVLRLKSSRCILHMLFFIKQFCKPVFVKLNFYFLNLQFLWYHSIKFYTITFQQLDEKCGKHFFTIESQIVKAGYAHAD